MKKVFVVLGVVAAALVFGAVTALAQSSPTIKFVKPVDRHNVPIGQVDVTVEVNGASPADGYSWQLLVDSVPELTVHDSLSASFEMPQPSGPRRMKAVLLDPQGKAVSSDEILVMAAPLEKIDPAFNRSWFAPAMAVFSAIVIGLILLGLRIRRKSNPYAESET